MKYKLADFHNQGVAWPFSLKNNLISVELEKNYFLFQEMAIKYLGKKQSLKPHLLSTFFDQISHDEDILKNVKKVIGENIYLW